MTRNSETSNKLVGTWKLLSMQFEFSETGERVDVYGESPLGFLIFTEEDRMMAILTSDGRIPPKDDAGGAALFESMMAYCGKYRIEGEDKFIANVDVAWHPAWNGTEQARFFKIHDDTLSITTAQQTHPMFPGRIGRGVLAWQRA